MNEVVIKNDNKYKRPLIPLFFMKREEDDLFVSVFLDRLDRYSPAAAKLQIFPYLKVGVKRIIFDFSNITYISSSFLSLIFIITKEYPEVKVVINSNKALNRFFSLIGGEGNYLLKGILVK